MSEPNPLLAIGLMSGTSMDGIDASLVYTNGQANCLNTLATTHFRYPASHHFLLKALEYSLQQTEGQLQLSEAQYESHLVSYLQEACAYSPAQSQRFVDTAAETLSISNPRDWIVALAAQNTEYHIQVVKQLYEHIPHGYGQPDLIAYPGQTLFHAPERAFSYTLGNAVALSEALGIPVVHCLRDADLAAGGQGAPLAPLYHQALAIQQGALPIGVINCGGVANLSVVLGPDSTDLWGFDTGPGNALLDRHIKHVTQGQFTFDENGRWAKAGHCDSDALQELIEKGIAIPGFLQQKPPKSLDSRQLILTPLVQQLSLPDACRTLATFTAHCLLMGIEQVRHEMRAPLPLDWVFCGGGALNTVIVSAFETGFLERFNQAPRLHPAEYLGNTAFSMEPALFAYLGVRSYYNLPISFPQTTGVPIPLSGGEWVYPRSDLHTKS